MGTRGRGVALTLCVLMEHHHQSLRLAYLSRTRPGQAMAGRSMVTNTKVTHKHLLVSYWLKNLVPSILFYQPAMTALTSPECERALASAVKK